MTIHILIADSSSLAVVGSETPVPRNRANLFAVAGGLIQMALSLGVLFLPVFATCIDQGQTIVCQRQSYIQQGGSIVGYAFLGAIVAASVLVLASTRLASLTRYARRIRWIAVLLSAGFVVVGAWSIGLIFVPGGILLLLSALFSRQVASQQNRTVL